jgi:predicted RNA binding protein YcfA (HicA-like mRNA interferase family)
MSSQSLADISQQDWIRACKKLGLVVDMKHGKGSHVLICQPQGGAKYTIQCHLHKLINQKIFSKLRSWGFSEEQIWEVL